MEKVEYDTKGSPAATSSSSQDNEQGSIHSMSAGAHHLKRKLRSKEVQMFCMGTTIGTSLFVQMGSALPKAGPAGLLIGFIIWGGIMWCVNECFAEMVCLLPVPSPFITLGGKWVDEAFGFAMSWNFFIKEALLIPYEIVAFNILLNFWTDAVPSAAIVVVVAVAYAFLHLVNVRYFGITEMYISVFKLALICGLILFTFITMLGGNPLHDRYGFRYWKSPGSFVEYKEKGDAGHFLGVLAGFLQAAFTYNGPEYISMIASEAELPRTVMPKAFKHVTYRILIFFIGSALCIGILIPYNDPTLAAIYGGTKAGSGTAAASPYVIAMENLKISGLPHVVNALIMTSVFSSGNGVLYATTRTMFGMSIDGKAPKFMSKTLKSGIPVYSVLAGLAFCLLGFLQIKTSSAKVISWLVSLVTASQLINYLATAITYRHFYSSMKTQGIDRNSLPYKGRFQPYTSYVAIAGPFFGILANGWTNFLADATPFSLRDFFLNYTFIGVFPIFFLFWKLVKRTKYVRPGTADLSLGGIKEEIDDYEETYIPRNKSMLSAWIDGIF